MNKTTQEIIQRDCSEVLANQVSLLSDLKNQCLLITGGTGFMGTWLTEMVSFLNDSYHFNTKLILLSEHAYNFSEKAPHLAKRKDVVLLTKGIASVVELPEEVTMILHAAANPDNRLHASEPLHIAQSIVNGTAALLAAASRLPNLKRMVNVSSGLVYGSQPLNVDAIPENYCGGPDCSSASSAYAEGKRFAETLCGIYRNQYKMPIINVRPFAFIGPYQLLDRPWAINNFLHDSFLGGPIRILGDGETVRSYMYPSDMAFWLLRIVTAGVIGKNYNVGSPVEITLRQLADKIANHFTIKPQIVSGISPNAKKDRSKFVPDISLVQATLGLNITVDIDEALKRTLLWNRQLIL
jgi:nucleoside-diphosphate-sugar epimerase